MKTINMTNVVKNMTQNKVMESIGLDVVHITHLNEIGFDDTRTKEVKQKIIEYIGKLIDQEIANV